MHITRRYINKKNEGFGDFWHSVFSPLQTASRQIEKTIIDPIIVNPILKPISRVMPKITIAGHRYDLGGNQVLIKSTTGAVAGFAMAGPWGALAGAAAANLQHGKPNVLDDLLIGAGAGALTGVALMYTPVIAPTVATGTTGAVVAGAGGAGAGGGILATSAQALAVTSGALGLASKTGVLPTKKQTVDQSGNMDLSSQPQQNGFNFNAASIFTGGNIAIFFGLSALTVIGYVFLHNKNRDLSSRK